MLGLFRLPPRRGGPLMPRSLVLLVILLLLTIAAIWYWWPASRDPGSLSDAATPQRRAAVSARLTR